MIFDSLQPDPIIDPVKTVSFAKQPGDKVVIRKIGIEHTPSRKYALPQEQHRKQRGTRDLQQWQERKRVMPRGRGDDPLLYL
jgi:hypothetical protein